MDGLAGRGGRKRRLALPKLGRSASFAGCIGADAAGDLLAALLWENSVDTSLLTRHPAAPTREVLVARGAGSDRTFAGFRGGRPSGAFADAKYDLPLLYDDTHGGAGVRWCVASTMPLAYPTSRRTVHALVDGARARGARLCVDVNWRPCFWPGCCGGSDIAAAGGRDLAEAEARATIMELVSKADLVELTDEEAGWLLGERVGSASAAFSQPGLVRTALPNATVRGPAKDVLCCVLLGERRKVAQVHPACG